MKMVNKEVLRIGHLSTMYHTNFILMGVSSFREDLNVNVKWTLFGTGPEMVKAFERKELDIGYMGLPPAIIGIDRGVPIKCVAGGHIEGTIIISKKEFKNLQELNNNLFQVFNQFIGKNIGVTSKGSIHEVILSSYLEKFDLKDKINVKYYSQAEFIALNMKNGTLDAGVGTPALAVFASTILKSKIIVSPDKLWHFNPSYGIFFSESFSKSHRDLGKIFLKYHKEASGLLREQPELVAKRILSNFSLTNEQYIRKVLTISPRYCMALPKEYVESTLKFVEKLHELNYIKNKLNINNIFNFSYINEIHPEKHHY
ncbi:MAG: ABC transporter substrate-binding protein [Promethearchaeota archaeon]